MVRTIICPDCGLEFDEEFSMDAKEAAESVLRHYTGHCFSGDAIKVQEAIEDALSKVGVSIGKI